MGGVTKLLIEAFRRPDEAWAMLAIRSRMNQVYAATEKETRNNVDWRYCYEKLNKVSRSFALVIQQLAQPEQKSTELRDAVCIFYLVLRALDTIEDDMVGAEKNCFGFLDPEPEYVWRNEYIRDMFDALITVLEMVFTSQT